MAQFIKPVSQNMRPSGPHSSYQLVIRLKSRKDATIVVVVSTVSQYQSIPLHYTTGCVYNDNNSPSHVSDLHLERCQAVRDLIPHAKFRLPR